MLIYWPPSYVIIYRSYTLLKMCGFIGPPCRPITLHRGNVTRQRHCKSLQQVSSGGVFVFVQYWNIAAHYFFGFHKHSKQATIALSIGIAFAARRVDVCHDDPLLMSVNGALKELDTTAALLRSRTNDYALQCVEQRSVQVLQHFDDVDHDHAAPTVALQSAPVFPHFDVTVTDCAS